jgi:predicted ATP-grasp superfamily ATP-dependent carboligase
MKKSLFSMLKEPSLDNPDMLVLWSGEVRGLEQQILSHITSSHRLEEFCRIIPSIFFTLDGVHVKDNVAMMPSSFFYRFSEKLVILVTDSPNHEWYRFLMTILEVAELCRVKEIVTIGTMLTVSAHTTPRELYGIFSSEDARESIGESGLSREVDYFTPQGHHPTLSSYLLWVSGKKGINAVNVWVSEPFYLTSAGDPKARKIVLEYLDRRFSMGLDYRELNEEIKAQNEKLGKLRLRTPAIDECLMKLESGLPLSDDETVRLVREVDDLFGS